MIGRVVEVVFASLYVTVALPTGALLVLGVVHHPDTLIRVCLALAALFTLASAGCVVVAILKGR